MSEQVICGHCGLPIHKSESGIRHFGHFTAHSEARCLELLKADLSEARQEVGRLSEIVKVAQMMKDSEMQGVTFDDVHGGDNKLIGKMLIWIAARQKLYQLLPTTTPGGGHG